MQSSCIGSCIAPVNYGTIVPRFDTITVIYCKSKSPQVNSTNQVLLGKHSKATEFNPQTSEKKTNYLLTYLLIANGPNSDVILLWQSLVTCLRLSAAGCSTSCSLRLSVPVTSVEAECSFSTSTIASRQRENGEYGQLAILKFNTYTPCLKKLCQLIFCSLFVKYKPISIKIGRTVPE